MIVGAGVIGAATAFAARRAGLDPLVVEARAEPAAATTAAATGAYRLQQDDPDELKIMRETVAAMYDFAAFTGQTRHDPKPRPSGLMSVTTSEEGAAEQRETVEHQRSIGVDGIELLDGDEAAEALPVPGRQRCGRCAYVCRTACWISASSRSDCSTARGYVCRRA